MSEPANLSDFTGFTFDYAEKLPYPTVRTGCITCANSPYLLNCGILRLGFTGRSVEIRRAFVDPAQEAAFVWR
jgi:hypothetical protein